MHAERRALHDVLLVLHVVFRSFPPRLSRNLYTETPEKKGREKGHFF